MTTVESITKFNQKRLGEGLDLELNKQNTKYIDQIKVSKTSD